MTRSIDQILAEQRKLEVELERVRTEQRSSILADVREKVKLFGFTASELKGVLVQRRKRGTGPAAKTAVKRTKRK